MTHETSIVLLARQVDDFALGCIDDETARGVMTLIGKCIWLPSKTVIPITFQDVLTSFNGYDVLQNG
jgi:hypothetical protein